MDSKLTNPFPGFIRKIAVIAPSHQLPNPDLLSLIVDTYDSIGIEAILFPSCLIDEAQFKESHAIYPFAPLEVRIDDIHSCWNDSSIDLVLPLMGGGALAEIFPFIDWKLLEKRQLPVLGYSDISSLHLSMLSKGIGFPIASPNAFGLAQAINRGDALTCSTLRQKRFQFLFQIAGSQKTSLKPLLEERCHGRFRNSVLFFQGERKRFRLDHYSIDVGNDSSLIHSFLQTTGGSTYSDRLIRAA